VLFIGWGSTFGSIRTAVRTLRTRGASVGQVHLRNLNPLPRDLGDIMKRYETVIVPELNMGQLATILRAKFLVDVVSHTKVQGKPFKESELLDAVSQYVENKNERSSGGSAHRPKHADA
jgi:2-oxoglutarate ferredoxin oxidoreductase subunit alpha